MGKIPCKNPTGGWEVGTGGIRCRVKPTQHNLGFGFTFPSWLINRSGLSWVQTSLIRPLPTWLELNPAIQGAWVRVSTLSCSFVLLWVLTIMLAWQPQNLLTAFWIFFHRCDIIVANQTLSNYFIFVIVFFHSFESHLSTRLYADIKTGVEPCTYDKTIFFYTKADTSSGSIFVSGFIRNFRCFIEKLKLLGRKIRRLKVLKIIVWLRKLKKVNTRRLYRNFKSIRWLYRECTVFVLLHLQLS